MPAGLPPGDVLDRRPWLAALVGLLVSVPYWPGGPVWDDHTLIVGHLAPTPLADLPAFWWHAVGLGDTGAAYFRPLSTTLLTLLGRVGVPAVHVATGLLHAASAALVCRLGGCTRRALLGALLFAVHPLGWEVLGWASALPDALAVTLGLGAWALGRTRRPGWLALVVFLGLCSKESALIWLGAGLAAQRFDRRDLGAIGAGVLVAAGLRWGAGVSALPPISQPTVLEAGAVVLHQLGSLVAPLSLTAVRDTHHLSTVRVAVGGGVVVATLLAAARSGPLGRGAAVALLAAPLVALPTTLSSHIAADRYVYASIAAAGLLVARLPVPRLTSAWASGLVVVVGAVVHLTSAPAWRSDSALFSHAVAVTPASAYAHHFHGHALGMRGDWAAAAAAFDRAHQLEGAHPLSVQLALEAWVRAGEPARAAALGRSAGTEGLTADWLAWWARAEHDLGRPEAAARLLAPLRRPDGSWDGPPFVEELAHVVAAAVRRPDDPTTGPPTPE